MARFTAALLWLPLALTARQATACPPTYEVVGQLEYSCGSQYTIFAAEAMNESRQVVGHVKCHISNVHIPFYWTPQDGLQLLPMNSDNVPAFAHDINEHGVITGEYLVPSLTNGYVAYTYRIGDPAPIILWSPDDEGWPFQGGFGIAINDQGVVAGVAPDPQGVRRACVWETVHQPTFLPIPIQNDSSIALGISDSNRVAYEVTDGAVVHAFLNDLGRPDPRLVVQPREFPVTIINDMNAHGAVACNVGETYPTSQAAFWDDNTLSLLPTPPATEFSRAAGITDNGVIYGAVYGDFEDGLSGFGVAWENGQMRSIRNILAPDLTVGPPMAMNSNGGLVASTTAGYLVIGRIHFQPADLNCDQMTSFADLLALLAQWGPCGASCVADLDGDGGVGPADLTLLLRAWSP